MSLNKGRAPFISAWGFESRGSQSACLLAFAIRNTQGSPASHPRNSEMFRDWWMTETQKLTKGSVTIITDASKPAAAALRAQGWVMANGSANAPAARDYAV
jgi:hypothetical protein